MNEQILSVIEEIKAVRKGENRAWIFDEEGNIKNDVFVIDIIPLLNEMAKREEEIEVPSILNKATEDFFNDYDIADNTYNYNCNISNDIDYRVVKGEYGTWALIKVHLCGDIRANYSDSFIIDIGEYPTLIDYLCCEYTDYIYDYKDIDENHYGDFDMFSESVRVVNNETGEEVDVVYEYELSEILKEIEGGK